MVEALDIQVKGIVQGVGFRPFVYRLAKKYLINGWVLNATEGVRIHAEGEAKLLDEFVTELHMNPPAAAKVKEVDLAEVPLEDFSTFEIRFSDDGEAEQTTLVSPDLATCDDCLAELFNPNDRRYRYPFINCTNCGPRFTIIDSLPYDRPATSMKAFEMCPHCAGEYADPADRRFHAQPDACWECGPAVSICLPADRVDSTLRPPEARHLAPCAARGSHQSTLGAVAGQSDAPQVPSLTLDACPHDSAEPQFGTLSFAPCSDDPAWSIAWGGTRAASDAIFAAAVRVLKAGGIVAVKGLGGFHLVCDAENPEALAKLRERKRRQGKAFSVMVATADDARRVCRVDAVEQEQLESTKRPIVLLRKRPEAQFAPGLADKLPELGVMLPCTPVQHLLLHDFAEAIRAERGEDAFPMLVMTSGNMHNEPIVTDDAQARAALGGIADVILGNNREILSRYDDSVLRVVQAGGEQAIQFVRRARGFAPLPLTLDCPEAKVCQDALLAVGSEQKATFALVRAAGGEGADAAGEPGGATADAAASAAAAVAPADSTAASAIAKPEALVSQHVGDVENAETYDAWLEAKSRYEKLFQEEPKRYACDLHPEYLTSKWAREQAESTGAPLFEVQHHHAHIASVLGENGLFGPVCGIAFDGTGYGVDGRIWGGEVMVANQQAFERFANFAYVPMPGGAAAVRDPRRMAYGVMYAFDLLEHPAAAALVETMGQTASLCDQMIERDLNTPYTSSVGRLFDAASALLGVCPEPTYEGQPAIELEAAMGVPAAEPAATAPAQDAYRIDVVKNTATKTSTAQDTSVVLFDAAPAFVALLDDLQAGTPVSTIARRFHDAFVNAVLMAAQLANSVYGITTVALAGGVFLNRYLVEHATALLQEAGFTVALNRDLPPSDGCISFGQAVVAWAQDKTNEHEAETN